MNREIENYFKVCENFNHSNFASLLTGRRVIAIAINALCHSIQKQKFELMHVKKTCRHCEDLDYVRLIGKLCEKSEEFRDTIELYNSLCESFGYGDPANIHNPDFLWRRRSRK